MFQDIEIKIYVKFINYDIANAYGVALLAYILIAPIIFLVFRPVSIHKSHSIAICNYVKRLIQNVFNKENMRSDYKTILNLFIPNYVEQQSLMIIFIKFFFGSIMICGLYNNYYIFKGISTFDFANFPFLFISDILFTIDLLIFSFGYLTELGILHNKIRTVDTSIAGIFFCLLCYPPFNSVTFKFIRSSSRYVSLSDISHQKLACVLYSVGLIFLTIYVLASVALGTKASNLTNRGIIKAFPYNIVRHPAYISKNIFWLCSVLVLIIMAYENSTSGFMVFISQAFFILVAWAAVAAIYYFRALTEEQHLMRDPDYREYVNEVKYRFSPHII